MNSEVTSFIMILGSSKFFSDRDWFNILNILTPIVFWNPYPLPIGMSLYLRDVYDDIINGFWGNNKGSEKNYLNNLKNTQQLSIAQYYIVDIQLPTVFWSSYALIYI